MNPTNIRIDPDDIDRADALVGPTSKAYPWARTFTRSSILRLAVSRGLAALESEFGITRPEPVKVKRALDAAVAKVAGGGQ